MRRTPWTLRATALISAGSLALHELRYLIVGQPAGREHAYLPLADLLAGVLVAVAVGQLVRVVARARRTGSAECESAGPVRMWLAAAAVLLLVHIAQESAEAVLSGGSALTALAGVFGTWATLPLALAIGALVALGLRGASALVAAVARRARVDRRPATAARRPRLAPSRRIGAILALHLAGRAPPVVGRI